jgi:HEAT repeat protein
MRAIAAEAIGRIGHPDGLKSLPTRKTGINDPDEKVRANAAWALGKIGHQDGLKPLTTRKTGINDPLSGVREYAAEAIGKIGHPDAIHHLAEALNDEHEGVRANAAEALGQIGHKDGIKPLIKTLNDESPTVHTCTIEALGEIADAIKEEQPEHPAVIAIQHINPEEHAKAFIKLYEALERGEHEGKPPEWITTYAKQLKALEGNLKGS